MISALLNYLANEFKKEALFLEKIASSTQYVIKAGDTLYSISRQDPRYQDLIKAANPNVDFEHLKIGQIIIIPPPPVYHNEMLRASERIIKFIKSFEKLNLSLYNDGFGNLTIGYGHKILSGESYKKISLQQAEQILKSDIKEVETFLHKNITAKLTQNQFDALVSLTFNIGKGNLMKTELFKAVNAANLKKANEVFPQTFVEIASLASRRKLEAGIFRG